MWPSRRYWLWNLRLWLLLVFAFLLVGVVSGDQISGDIYALTLLSEVWVIASCALWFTLVAGHFITGVVRRFASPS